MAGGYDGSLRFDARIDKDGFLRSVADLEKALTMLEQALKGMQSVITGNFDAIKAEAEQAASDIGNIAAEAEAIPPSEDVAVTVSEQGIEQVQTALDSIPDEEVQVIPDMVWTGEVEAVEVPVEMQVDTTELQSAYDIATDKIKRKFSEFDTQMQKLGTSLRMPSRQVGTQIGDGISQGIEAANPLRSLQTMLKRAGGLVASFFGIRALVSFGKESIELASNITEVQNVVDTAFGQSAHKIEEFANIAVKQYGISRLTAKQTGSTYMAMAKGMEVAEDTASDMAVALTGLSADFASFYNVEQEVAATALNSVFTGETETLKKFGIVMTETNLQQFALTQGITKSVSAMTQAEKVQLRYAYVMNQGSLANGDFARTANTWANQVRILQEQWKEFASQVGQVLKNVFLPIVQRLNAILSSLIAKTESAVTKLSQMFGWETEAGSSTSAAVQEMADSYGAVEDSADDAAKAMDKTLSSYDELHKVGEETTTVSADAGTFGAVDAVTSPYAEETQAGTDAVEKFASKWETRGQETIDTILASWEKVKDMVGAVKESFQAVFENGTGETTLNHLLGIFNNIVAAIGNIAAGLHEAWQENDTGTQIVQSLWNILNNVPGLAERLTGSFRAWSSDVDFSPMLQGFAHIADAIDKITGDDGFGADFQWFLDNVLSPIATWTVESLIPKLLEDIGFGLEALKAIWDAIRPYVYDILWEKFLKPLDEWTADKAEKALTAIGNALKYIADNFGEDDALVLASAVTAVGALIAAVKGYEMLQKGVAAVSGLWTTLTSTATLSAGTVGASILAFFAAYEGMSAFLDKNVYDGKDATDWWAGFWEAGFADNWKAGTNVDDYIADFADSVSVGYQSIGESITELGKDITSGWTTIVSGVKTGWNGYVSSWGSGWDSIKNGASRGWTTVQTTLSSGWDAVTGKVSEWGTAWSTTADNIKQSATSGWDSMKLSLSEGWDGITDSINEWKHNWTDCTDTVKQAATEKWSEIKEDWQSGWEDVQEKFDGWKQNWTDGVAAVKKEASEKWSDIKKDLKSGWDGVTKKVTEWSDKWGTELKSIKENAIGKWDEIKTSLGDGWEALKGNVSDFGANWNTGWDEIQKKASDVWSNVKETLGTGWDTVTGEIDTFKENWQSGFDTIEEKAAAFKEAIGKVFSHIWSGDDGSGGLKGVLNSILGGIEDALNFITNRINALIENVNSEGITFFEHTRFEQTLFDLHIPTLPTFSVPRLATGTVVPANFGEFSAILGDNKREPEIVSPISAMKQAMQEVLDAYGGGDKNIVVQLVCDGRKLAEVVKRYDNSTGRVTNGGAKR